MDNYGGYKLKPSSYSIQPNDIIIRVRAGVPDMPDGQIDIALGHDNVKTHTQECWNTNYITWRAIETRPGSEAKVGDTVYCIKHTGDCQVHDSFIVKGIKISNSSTYLSPLQGHKLLNEKIVQKDWCWSSDNFVILVKASEEISPTKIILDEPSGFYGLAHPLYYVTTKEKVKGINGMLSKAGKIIYTDYGSETFILQCCWKTRAEASIARKNYLKGIASSDITPVDPSEAKPGDYVEWADGTIPTMTNGNYYKVVRATPDKLRVINNLSNEDIWAKTRFKKIIKETETWRSYIDFYDTTAPTTVTTITEELLNEQTQTKPNTKGKQMNSNLFTDILKLLAKAEQTDLQKAPSTYAFFYNNEGEYEGTARVANEAEAKALLQKPEHLGYTMRIYSFSDEFTTQIPVVSTIKKTVVAKPAIKPTRKPKATEAA